MIQKESRLIKDQVSLQFLHHPYIYALDSILFVSIRSFYFIPFSLSIHRFSHIFFRSNLSLVHFLFIHTEYFTILIPVTSVIPIIVCKRTVFNITFYVTLDKTFYNVTLDKIFSKRKLKIT